MGGQRGNPDQGLAVPALYLPSRQTRITLPMLVTSGTRNPAFTHRLIRFLACSLRTIATVVSVCQSKFRNAVKPLRFRLGDGRRKGTGASIAASARLEPTNHHTDVRRGFGGSYIRRSQKEEFLAEVEKLKANLEGVSTRISLPQMMNSRRVFDYERVLRKFCQLALGQSNTTDFAEFGIVADELGFLR
jgi:hypothetical protein